MINLNAVSISRRTLLKAAGAATALGAPLLAQAAWPADKPIRLVVPSAAGGSPDLICRILTAELTKQLGQAFVVDNKPGAGGAIGMQELTRAAPDGYTLGYGNVVTLAINQSLYKKLPYDADKQLSGVALMGYVQNALVVNNNLPAKTVAELVALAKSKPGRLTMGSAGNGTTGHLGGELFKSMSGAFITHVPYRGSPQAIQDLIGGQIDLMFDNLSSIGQHIKAGRVRALAVSGTRRSGQFPDLPTVAQAGAALGLARYETTAWGGIVAPAGLPLEITTRLNAEINKALFAAGPKFAELSFETTIAPAARLMERAMRERPMWAQVIARSGAKVD